jgi:hypothetical protein
VIANDVTFVSRPMKLSDLFQKLLHRTHIRRQESLIFFITKQIDDDDDDSGGGGSGGGCHDKIVFHRPAILFV